MMGKIVFWIVVVFAVLLVLRLLNAAKAKRRADAARRGGASPRRADGALRALRRVPATGRCPAGAGRIQLRRRELRAAPMNDPETATAMPMPTGHAMELVEPPPMPAAASGSGRRNLLTVGLYRVACGVILFGVSLLLDLRQISIAAPYSFVTAAALYLAYGLTALWWIRHDSLPLPLPALLTTLLGGDIFFLALLTLASSGTGGPLPILLFPQLAASGWMLQTRTAFLHAALATIVLLTLDVYGLLQGR